MKGWTNYHNHSYFCDGVETLEEHVIAAIQQGVLHLGFSSHCPLHFSNPWSMSDQRIPEYLLEIDRLKEKYHHKITLYKSLEVDYFPDGNFHNQYWKQNTGLDYTIGSVHFIDQFEDGQAWEIDGTLSIFKKGLEEIFHNDIKAAILRYFEIFHHMLDQDCPDIIGHLDKIKMHNSKEPFFDENAEWYQKSIDQVLVHAAEKNVIIEVNTRGIYKKITAEPYPSISILKKIQALKIPICLNSDAHHPKEVTAEYGNVSRLLKVLGFDHLMVFDNGVWLDRQFDHTGIFFD